MNQRALLTVTGPVAVLACGCGQSAPATAPTEAATGAPRASSAEASKAPEVTLPGQPSRSAKMVCESEAEGDITGLLGIPPDGIDTPTWVDSTYSCRYRYPGGSFTLSVKELPDRPVTDRYYQDLGTRMGNVGPLSELGEGGFMTSNSSVVTRKDDKVLLVDASRLPPALGRWSLGPAAVARTVATAIMGC